jgi:RHS repeat-associated protein
VPLRHRWFVSSLLVAALAPGHLSGQTMGPKGGTQQALANAIPVATFWISNNTGISKPFNLNACVPSGAVTACSAPSAVFVPSGQTTNFNVTFSTGSPGTGRIDLSLSGGADAGWLNVTVTAGQGVAITPHVGTTGAIANSSGNGATFTVLNTGSVQNTFAFTCGAMGNVSCGTPPAQVTLGAGLQTNVSLPYSPGDPGTGKLSITASGTNATDAGTYTVSINGVTVTPHSAMATTRTANTGGYSESFTVQNNGSTSNTFTFSCNGVNNVTCGSVPAPVTLAGFAQTTVGMPYSVSVPGTGVLSLTASGTNASDVGNYTVPVAPPYAVTVTPHGGVSATRAAYAGGYYDSFTVQNTGTSGDTYSFICTSTGGLSCDTALAPVAVAGLSQKTVNVRYSVRGPGTDTLRLTASGTGASDVGSYNVSVVGPPSVTPTGPLIARDLCLTIAAGRSAAYECGDLRIVHPLPSVRTLDKLRTPTLLYNSQQAYPFPSLNADLTLAANDRPDSIIAIARLKVGGFFVQRDRRAWAGSQWGAPTQTTTRRVMTNFAAGDLATGLYAFQLELDRFVVGAGYTAIRTDTGTVAIVNRFGSPFGAGWWLAGFEQLQFLADSSILWIGGNGSVRRYVKAGSSSGTTWYVARSVDGPDILSFDGTTYTRVLKGGVKVLFNPNGFHTQTVNRLGYATVFAPDASNRLSTITLPPSGSGRTYTFTYGGPNGTLSSVAAPDSLGASNRVTTINNTALTGGARISGITDPGISTSVQFVYGNASYPGTITGRTDRRGATTTYVLGTGLKLLGDSLPVPGAQTIRQTFCPAEIRVWACGTGLTAPESTYTIYDGPRTDSADVSNFWLDSLGAVTQIRDAYNNLTMIARTDTRWPELASRVQSPSGRIMAATYDARGNLVTVADSNPYGNGQNPTTQYVWDQTWDQLTQVSLPNGQLTQFGVNASNGNRLWMQDARGTVSRTTYQYYASGNGAGLLSTVIPPTGAQTTIAYDVRGNTASGQTGAWTTYYANDSIGRTKVVRSPLGGGGYRTDTTAYDAADRAVRVSSYGPAVGSALAGLATTYNYYDAESNRYQVQRIQSPDSTFLGTLTTQWTFDAANRPTVEIAPDGHPDSTQYDPAGNVVTTKTRNGDTLTMTYDRMNRLRQRVVPTRTYAARTAPGLLVTLPLSYDNYAGTHPYPWYPNNGSGLQINADTAKFSYDAGGRLIAADNGAAHVHRTYFKDGNVQTDSLSIRNYRDTTFGHVYVLRYTYDLNGRPTALHHPAQLAIGTGMRDSIRYVYNDTTGAIASVFSLLGNQTTFLYDLRGNLVREALPGGIVDSMVYDSLGRLTLDRIANGSTSPYKDPDSFLRYATLQYADLQYGDPMRVSAALNTHGWKDTVQVSYSGLGQLTSLTYSRPQNGDSALYVGVGGDGSGQGFTMDPIGNAYSNSAFTRGSIGYGDSFSQSSGGRSYYHTGTGRSDSTNDAGGRRGFVYDSAGNTLFFYQASAPGNTLNDRASWYAADGRLRVAEWRSGTGTSGNWTNPAWHDVFEEYRYDALGRRVLVMSRQGCWLGGGSDSASSVDCSVSRVRRTIWDGARELWEIQMPARTQDSLLVENDTATVTYWAGTSYQGQFVYSDPSPLFGRVAYTYAGGVDHPVSLTRLKLVRRKTTSDTAYWNPVELDPNWNWRGEADIGTFADGGMETCTNNTHCVFVQWRGVAFAVGLASELLWTQYQVPPQSPYGWFGTLIQDKADGTGSLYRRNRSVDPTTGRFTQEDPLGLAGGLNLYGFAGGDPINYSDPFGLKPCKDAQGKEIPCPEPEGGPPVPLPEGKNGEANSWEVKSGSGKRTKYGPKYPVPSEGGEQPGGSWDPDEGHWDVDNLGVKGRRRFDPNGKEVTHEGDLIYGPQQFPTPSPDVVRNVGGAALAYWIISEGLRILVPPRNFVPVP